MICLIAAVSKNNVIGKNGTIPWMGELSIDMRWFRQTTNGNIVVMGRKTFESIGKPLKGRTNMVMSRNDKLVLPDGVFKVKDPIDVMKIRNMYNLFIIGGSELYREMLPFADRLYITRVHAEFDGDTFFPEVDWEEWNLISSESYYANNNNKYDCEFCVYERVKI